MSLPTFCQYQCIYKILSKSINWSTRYWAKMKFQHQSRAISLLKMNENYYSIIQIYILTISMHIQNLIEIHKLIHKILSINKILTSIKIHSLFLKIEILTSIKGFNSVEKVRKISCASHNIAYTKFHQNPSIFLKILNGNKVLTSIKGHHNSVEK